ncbi:MAG: glycosyltransferase family 4 protein [Altibacter sp.]|nr:glycosyltransferase family 4 protein [Altibacter sp.]
MTKRVLIIAYYWPPAGGPGVQRWLKFVKYLPQFDVEPIVYVPENPSYPIIDRNLEDEVPQGITILKSSIKEPYRFARWFSKGKTKKLSSGMVPAKNPGLLERFLLYVRGNFFIPDARIGWVAPSVRYLSAYLDKNPVDLIITTGPPHSLHLIGLGLQQQMSIPWLADFRDPWTTIHYHKSLQLTKASARKHKRLEARVLRLADHILVTSPTTKKEFEMMTETPISVITNGFEIANDIVRRPDTAFSIAHIGSLLSERNPKVLWRILSEIASEEKEFKKDLVLKFAGVVSDTAMASITAFGLERNVENLGYVSHSEALQLQHNAHVLLLVEIDRPETRAIIPGKLFEYLAAKRPIIAIGPEGSDVEVILSETKSGHYFTYHDEERLKSHILEQYKAFKNGESTTTTDAVEQYSRPALTRRLASLLKEITQ